MSKIFKYKEFILLGILSGVLISLSFPPRSLWWLSFISLVPVWIGIYRARTYRDVMWLGGCCSVVFTWLGYHFISFVAVEYGGLPWIVAQIILILFSLFGEMQLFLFPLVAFSLLKLLKKNKRRAKVEAETVAGAFFWLCMLPILYVAIDFAYPKIFPSTLGLVLYRWLSVAQAAEYCGTYGITFLVLLANAALAAVVYEMFIKNKKQRHEKLLISACTLLVVVGVAMLGISFWGKKRIAQLDSYERSSGRVFKYSLIQGNIGDIDKLASETGSTAAEKMVLETYRDLSLRAVQEHHPDLVIWPETAYPAIYTDFKDVIANRTGRAHDRWIYDLMKDLKTPLLFGGYSTLAGKDYNSAFLVQYPYELSSVYRKVILLPFGEYVPLGPLSTIVQSIVPTIANFGRGPGPMIMELPVKDVPVKLGPQICYEGILPEHARESVRLGAEVIVNLTNDSWFGMTAEPELHLLLTVFRSIELRRPLIRSTNTGITTVLGITGREKLRTSLFAPVIVNSELKLPDSEKAPIKTFYLKYGDLVAYFSCVISALVALTLSLPGVRLRMRSWRLKK